MISTTPFADAIANYKVIFFDSYGVLRTYTGAVPGVANTFDALAAANKHFYVITNDASRSPDLLAQSLHRQGLHAVGADRIISSGMLAKDFLDLKVKTGIVAYLGTEDSAHYIEHPGLEALPLETLEEKDFGRVNALVLLDDEGFDWVKGLNKAVNLMRRRTIPVILANADGAYPVNNQDVGIAIGGLGWMLEKIVGKKLIRFGKPDSQIFMYAYEQVLANLPGITKKDILMVGDTLQTDILGGNKFGLDTVLVLTGNTLPDDAETRIASTGIAPTFICHAAVI
ncbi:MAG: HAD-IIA family hydrolase [Bacteroidetes bacterium]|nr:MAG: HAD-IIA family hydrolase [Bacteroidota bacterium]